MLRLAEELLVLMLDESRGEFAPGLSPHLVQSGACWSCTDGSRT